MTITKLLVSVCFLLVLQSCLAADLVLLGDYPAAVCIDGTPGGFYFVPGNAGPSNNFILFMDGGGVCETPSDCYGRSLTTLGSSKDWPRVAENAGTGDGFLSNSSHFASWNKAVVQYCDGGRYSSNAVNPIVYNNTKLYFRGVSIMTAVVAELTANYGMNKAERVILSGCSAGGEGTYYLLDYIRSIIPTTVDVRGMADAGWFLDTNSVYGTPSSYTAELPGAFLMWNSSNLPIFQKCMVNFDAADQWKCLFAANLYANMEVPIFILQSQIDTMQLGALYLFPCDNDFPSCNSTEIKWLQEWTAQFQQSIAPAIKNPRDGIFMDECPTHCQSYTNWMFTEIDSVTPEQAFYAWYFNGTAAKYYDTCTYPCNSSCNSKKK